MRIDGTPHELLALKTQMQVVNDGLKEINDLIPTSPDGTNALLSLSVLVDHWTVLTDMIIDAVVL